MTNKMKNLVYSLKMLDKQFLFLFGMCLFFLLLWLGLAVACIVQGQVLSGVLGITLGLGHGFMLFMNITNKVERTKKELEQR